MTEAHDATTNAQTKPVPTCVCGAKVTELHPANRFIIEADKTDALPQIYCWSCVQKTLADREAANG